MREHADPHRRWPWVVMGVVALAIVAGLVAYAIWSMGSARRLARQIAVYRAAGEPIEPGDFVVRGVGDADNAVMDLRHAAATVDESGAAWREFYHFPDQFGLPLREDEAKVIRAVVQSNPAAFNAIDSAMTRGGVDWRLPLKSPVMNVLLPDLNEQRNLTRLLAARAMLSHEQGDDASAVADLHRILFLADAVDQQPLLVSHLVATQMLQDASTVAEQIAPDLRIGNGKGAPREQVARLIAALLDERSQRKGFTRAMMGERMMMLDTARCVADGRLGPAALNGASGPATPPTMASVALSAVIRPVALDDALLMVRHITAIRQAAERAAHWPDYQKIQPALPFPNGKPPLRHLLAGMMLPAYDRAAMTMFRAMTDRRLAGTALAMRCYAIDHNGNRPAALGELVPAHLPAVPVDAMAAGGRLIGYLNRPERPAIYSVGEDGVDDGGSEVSINRNGSIDSRWRMRDAVMHLTRQPRPPGQQTLSGADTEAMAAPTTQASP